MTRTERAVFALLAAIALAGLLVALRSEQQFNAAYVGEDGLLETATALALFFCAALQGRRVFRLRRVRSRLFLTVTALSVALFLFGAGEELSWGQRLLGYETPETIESLNTQGEMNVHNLQFGDFKVNIVIFSGLLGVFLVAYLLVLPWVADRSARITEAAARLAVPIPEWRQSLFLLAVTTLIYTIPASRKWELIELTSCAVFCLVLLYPRNREIYRPEA